MVSKSDLTDIRRLSLEELESVVKELGQPRFRARQIHSWLWTKGARSFEAMTDLPKGLRQTLAARFALRPIEVDKVQRSLDGTIKTRFRLYDGHLIESVLIPVPEDKRFTVCVSSQVGCSLTCKFCATGQMKRVRNLEPGEIFDQFWLVNQQALEHYGHPLTNIVYMGMGEPLANRKALHPSLTILNQGYGVGARRITVSTVGVVPGIDELARRPEQFGLALSLHAPTSGLRSSLIPLERRHPLPEVMEALERFNDAGGRRITFEYTMIKGINDDVSLAPEVAELARWVGAFVNLIPFNPIPYQRWRPSPPDRIAAFASVLEDRGVSVAVRESRGRDINAACGQLRAHALARKGGGKTA